MPIADAAFCRIQAEVDASDEQAIHWIEAMGFHKEFADPMENYELFGRGDFYLYVRFPDG